MSPGVWLYNRPASLGAYLDPEGLDRGQCMDERIKEGCMGGWVCGGWYGVSTEGVLCTVCLHISISLPVTWGTWLLR